MTRGAALLGLATGAAHANVVDAPHVQAELVAEHAALAPGANRVALRLAPEPGWHTYYREPGDVGLPTTLAWTLPDGFTAGPIEWPAPETFRLGEETSYGYSRETLHVVTLTVPAAAVGGEATLRAQASWLVCKDLCIPGKAQLSLTLPVHNAPGEPTRWVASFVPDGAEIIETAKGSIPLSMALGLALLGGLIMNLMPCVFQVLSIKAVSNMEAGVCVHANQRQDG
jgi:thiol:disulfide interchange protein DsbD